MMKVKSISTMQVNNTDTLLTKYREHTGNLAATADDLFVCLTTPTPEREIILLTCCNCVISITESIVQSTYTPQ